MKRSRRRKKRKRSGYFLFFLLAALGTVVGVLYFSQPPSPSKPLSHRILEIDEIIDLQLSEMDLSRKDILLHRASQKKEGETIWTQSHFKIRLPRSVPFPQIEKNLKKRISALGQSVSVQSAEKPEGFQLEVMVSHHLTHHLFFIPSPPIIPRSETRPQVAIVIDDLGEENPIAQKLLELNVPLTFSILPFRPYSQWLAEKAHRREKEILLHLPMEPHGYPKIDPGQGALLDEMDERNLLRQLVQDLAAVPHIKGVSNHMGSRMMEDPQKMRIIVLELKRRGLFFLDSRTTPHTVGFQIARAMGLKTMESSLFLDHISGEEAVNQRLEHLIQLSLSSGRAVAIGHPHLYTVTSLKEMIPKMEMRGIQIVPLSSLRD